MGLWNSLSGPQELPCSYCGLLGVVKGRMTIDELQFCLLHGDLSVFLYPELLSGERKTTAVYLTFLIGKHGSSGSFSP